MATYALPAGQSFHSFNGPNSITHVVSADHTAARPHIVISDRVMPSIDPRTGNVTFGRYRVRDIQACLDADGNPTGRNAVVELSIRFPPEAASADVQAQIDDLGTRASDDGFQDDSTGPMTLPPMSYVAP
jgi:hypothetical protein